MRTRNQRDILGATSRVALNSIFNENSVILRPACFDPKHNHDPKDAANTGATAGGFNASLVTALKWRVDRTLLTIEVLCPIDFNIDNPNILRMGLTNDMNQSYINISDGSATHGPACSYCCVNTNTPFLLATMTSGLPSLLMSPVVTCVPTPLSSSIRCGMNSALPLPSRLSWNQ